MCDHFCPPECQALVAQIRCEIPERDAILDDLATGDPERMTSFALELSQLASAVRLAAGRSSQDRAA